MAIAHAVWTHGHSVHVEYPERGKVERIGYWAKYLGAGPGWAPPNWLHFAIPTPVIVNDKRLRVGSVLVRWRPLGNGFISAIHVYDGENKISAKDNMPPPMPTNQWILERVDVPAHPEIQWGLGISILVMLGGLDYAGPEFVELAGAGCDFQ